MKKCINIATFFLFLVALPSIVSAEIDYPNYIKPEGYYHGNVNYIQICVHQGVITYLDTTSVVIKQFTPPVYQIAAITFYDNNGKLDYKTNIYKYVWSEYDADRVIFRKNPSDNNSWELLPRYDYAMYLWSDRRICEYLWWIAYRTEFWHHDYQSDY